MGKVTKTFKNGTPLTAEDINALVEAVNDNTEKAGALGVARTPSELALFMAQSENMTRSLMEYSTESGGVYDFVDLGLPSGLKWAKMNVGASAENEYGDYFAFGATEKMVPEEGDLATMYIDFSPSNSKQLELSEDAANANMGGGWRMPTREEMTELIENTDYEWCEGETAIGGVAGAKFMNKNDHSQYIFIPAAGRIYTVGTIQGIGKYIRLRTKSISSTSSCFLLQIDQGWTQEQLVVITTLQKHYGYSVRGVHD